MDNPWYIIGGIVVVVILVAGPFIRRWTRRKASEAGAKAGQKFAANNIRKANDKVPEMVGRFGETILLAAPHDAAKGVVATAAAKGKDFTPLDDDTFGIRFSEPTDTIVRLVPDAAGTRVQVERFREHMGYPMSMSGWEQFRKKITAAAATAGVAVTAGPAQSYTRGALVEGDNAEWLIDR